MQLTDAAFGSDKHKKIPFCRHDNEFMWDSIIEMEDLDFGLDRKKKHIIQRT